MTPYIPSDDRDELDFDVRTPRGGGELNYKIATVVDRYVEARGLSYATISDVVAALEGVKAEFYRKVAAPYEDRKALSNGEVFNASRRALKGS